MLFVSSFSCRFSLFWPNLILTSCPQEAYRLSARKRRRLCSRRQRGVRIAVIVVGADAEMLVAAEVGAALVVRGEHEAARAALRVEQFSCC